MYTHVCTCTHMIYMRSRLGKADLYEEKNLASFVACMCVARNSTATVPHAASHLRCPIFNG